MSHEQLASEVKQLIRERDHLLAQARKDSETLERKEIVIKAQYEEQLKESASKISQVKIFLAISIKISKFSLNYLSMLFVSQLFSNFPW